MQYLQIKTLAIQGADNGKTPELPVWKPVAEDTAAFEI